MNMPQYPTCSTCAHHKLLEGTGFLLCDLPPDCAPRQDDDEAMSWRYRDDMMVTYFGTDCDVMRHMGALCGPLGKMWRPKATLQEVIA